MKKLFRLFSVAIVILIAIVLSGCSETAENEHLPEYCRTYTGFIEFASPDLYELIGGTNSRDYLTDISVNQLEFEVYDENREIDLDGIQCFQNLTSLTLIGPGFKDISEISALKNIQQVSLIDTNVVSISSFRNLSKVNSLTISNTKTLQSVDGVEEMTKLTYLDLSDNGIVNIDGLNNLINLNTLILSNNEIIYFPSINNLQYLETLDVSNNNIIQLGEDLSGLSNLKNFDASENEICDLSTLDDLTSLETLDLSFNDLGCNGVSPDFSSLEGAEYLTELYLNDNDLVSISDLASRSLPLETLYLQNNLLTDITPISNFTTLEVLEVYNNQIVDINNLSGMANLTRIDLSQNLIEDFSDLRSIPDMELIDLSENNITFIPDISESWPSLKELDLSSNQLVDTSGVKGHPALRRLYLNNNGLETLSGISDLPDLEELILFVEPDLESEEPIFEDNPNVIRVIDDSFNDLPSMDLVDESGNLDFGFDLEPNGEIYGSFNDIPSVEVVDLEYMDIAVIDEFSMNMPNLEGINVKGNLLQDISFILGNPNLILIDISENPVTNLTILNGTTNDDLSNLEVIVATDISGVNHLDGAFVDLPDVSFIDLSNTTIASISNSFNNLDELSSLGISGASLEFIDNSFNNIFTVPGDDSSVIFQDGALYSITDSFNGGNYTQIGIIDNITLEAVTIIDGSFNNLTVSAINSIAISGNDFQTVSNSFNGLTVDNLFLANNNIQAISNSFEGTDIAFELNLQNNELASLDLNLITNVTTLDLANNALTTVAFIDAIPGLETLDISNQFTFDDTAVTLTVIDGINNMASLTSITLDGVVITEIDGFKNIGITAFEQNLSTNNSVVITSITSDSFSNSFITSLDLDGYAFTNIDFLQNFTLLEDLIISVDIADLSALNTMPLTTSLITLDLESVQNVSDFSVINNYDVLEQFTFSSSATTVLNNFDGLDSLESATFETEADITTVSNSFNNMPSLIISETYLTTFSALTTVNSSFDRFGLNGLNESVIISGDTIISNSFNNVVNVTVVNGVEVTPNYDGTSFDNIETLVLTEPLYNSYSFLNNYVDLVTVEIDLLPKDITDINYANLHDVIINDMAIGVTSLDIVIGSTGSLELSSADTKTMSISSNIGSLDTTTPNYDYILDIDNTSLILSGTMNDLTLNSLNLLIVNLNSFAAQSGTLNVDTLNGMTTNKSTGTDFLTLDINSNVGNLNYSVRANTININNDNASDYTLNASIATVYLNSAQASITADFNVDELRAEYPELVSFVADQNSSATDIYLTSTLLNSVIMNDTTSSTLIIDSDVVSLDLYSSAIDSVSLLTDNIANGTLQVLNGDLNMFNNVTSGVYLIQTDLLSVVNTSLESLVLNDTSVLNSLEILNSTSLDTVTYSGSQPTYKINTVTLSTDVAALSVDINYADIIFVDGSTLNDLTVLSSDADVSINTDAISLGVSIDAANFDVVSSANLDNMTILAGSTVTSTINVLESSQINNINLNTTNAGSINISSTETSFILSSANVASASITGTNFISMDIYVGSNDVAITSTSTGTLSIDLTADLADLTLSNSLVSFDNASLLTNVLLDNSNLQSLLLGNADISTLSVTDSAAILSISGTQVDNVNINTGATTMDYTIPLATVLDITSSAVAPVTVDTTTSAITMSANVGVTLNSASIDTVDMNIGATNTLTLNTTKPTLALSLDGTANEVGIESTTLQTLNVDPTSSFSSLVLTDTPLTTLDLSSSNINNVNIISDVATFNITSNNVTDFYIESNIINTLDMALPNADVSVWDFNTSIDVNGNVNTFFIDGPQLTTLDFTDITVSGLAEFSVQSLASLNVFNNASSVEIFAENTDFTLITDIQSVIFNADEVNTNNLNISSTLEFVNVTTNVDSLDVSGGTTNYAISGSNLSGVSGSAINLNLSDINVSTLSLDYSGNNVTVLGLVSTILFLDANTINDLSVNSDSLTTLATNNVTINEISVNSETPLLMTIDTAASSVDVNNTAASGVSFNVRNASQNINTNNPNMTFNSTNLSSASVFYSGVAAPLDVTANNVVNLSINSGFGTAATYDLNITSLELNTINSNSNVLIFEGTVTDLSMSGGGILSMNVDNFTVNGNLTLEDVDIFTDLSFMTPTLLASVDVITMNTLSYSNIENIVTTLEGTGIELDDTTITDTNVLQYYYNTRYDALTAQEAIDHVRYDAIYATYRANALAEFRLNTYFDHIIDDDLLLEIDAQSYSDAAYYLESYALSQGYTADPVEETTATDAMIVDLGQAAVDAIELSIQTTLDSSNLVIDSTVIDGEVDDEIVAEATSLSQTDFDNKGFIVTNS
jgi:Leucine-rich repeat (LRR) protein